jgi:tetratricopeptide (TPR) repeat protein
MDNQLSATAQQAIDAALKQDWNTAITLNTSILKTDKDNVDALNRIGFAYLQTGSTEEAKKSFERVLVLDQYNQVAQRNLTKLKNKSTVEINGTTVSPLMFLEEPGKTKVVACINLAPSATLSSIRCGQKVQMKVKKHTIELRDDQSVYIAALPDDISFKLSRLMQGGNQYTVIVRSVSKNNVTVFIREMSRGKEFANQPSFTPASTYVATSVRVDEQAEKPDITSTGEEDQDKME